MAELKDLIRSIEEIWFEVLHSHLNNLYSDFHLPSHDVEHHVRVWKICKSLIGELHEAGVEIDQASVIQLLMACMFHDTGLIKDSSESHGYQSRLFCEHFFSTNPDFPIEDKEQVLSAIELHDDKSLKDHIDSHMESFQDIRKLVSAADDLDAFGLIGVFRYLEIYLIRGVPLRELPAKVMVNLQNRFTNFERGFSVLDQYIERSRGRYQKAYNFFSELEVQCIDSKSAKSDHLSIVHELSECLISRKMDIHQTIDHALGKNLGGYYQSFFEDLQDELDAMNSAK